MEGRMKEKVMCAASKMIQCRCMLIASSVNSPEVGETEVVMCYITMLVRDQPHVQAARKYVQMTPVDILNNNAGFLLE